MSEYFQKDAVPYCRQGEVIICKINKLPDTSKMVKKNNKVIVEGETAGHKHELLGSCAIYDTQEVGGHFFMTVPEKTELVHTDHATIGIEPGIYEIQIQQELDMHGQLRRVTD